jgi:CHAT domain-containing protein/Tfp pilus assembly protein PilF
MYKTRSEISFCNIVLVFLFLLILNSCVSNSSHSTEKNLSPQILSESIQSTVEEGSEYYKNGDFKKSEEIFKNALEKARFEKDELAIGTSLFWLGSVYLYGYRDYQKALDYFTECRQYARKLNYLEGETFALLGIFDVYKFTGDDENALETINVWLPSCEILLAKESEIKKKKLLYTRAQAYWYKASIYWKKSEFDTALENYNLATSDFLKIDNFELAGKTLWKSGGVLHFNMGLNLDAIEAYKKASSLLQQAGKLIEANKVKIFLGLAYIDSWNFNESLLVYDDVLKFAEKVGSSDLLAQANLGIALTCYNTDKLYSSLEYCRVALDEFKKGNLNNNGLKADIYYLRGRLMKALGQYDKAFEDLHLASVSIRKIDNRMSSSMEALVLIELSDLYKWFGDHKMSIKYCKRALQLFEETGNVFQQIEAMISIADSISITYKYDPERARKYFKKGIKLLNSVTEKAGVNPPNLLLEAQKSKLSEDEIKEHLQYMTKGFKFKHEELAEAFTEISLMILNSPRAFQYWQNNAPSLGAPYLSTVGAMNQVVGKFSFRFGKLDHALEAFSWAAGYHSILPYNRKVGQELLLEYFCLGEIYRQKGNLEDAQRFFLFAHELALLMDHPSMYEIYAGLARTALDKKEIDAALKYYREAISLLDTVRSSQSIAESKIKLLESGSYIYQNFFDLLIDQNKQTYDPNWLKETFQYNEKMRARVFNEMLNKFQKIRFETSEHAIQLEKEKVLQYINQMHYRLQSAKAGSVEEIDLIEQVEHLRETLGNIQEKHEQTKKDSPDTINPFEVDVGDVQELLKNDEILLEYTTDKRRSILFAISKNQFDVHILPGKVGLPVLEEFLRTIREPLFGKKEIDQHISHGEQLYDWLIKPIERHLSGKTHLIISPDGPLYYLPFGALIRTNLSDEQKKLNNLTQINYLIRDFRISYIPSGKALIDQRKAQSNRKKHDLPLLAFGNPIHNKHHTYMNEDLAAKKIVHAYLRDYQLKPLEFSEKEVKRIAALFDIQGDSPHVNLGEKATVERLKQIDLTNYRFIHFASHGLLADKMGMATQPVLVLSEVNDEPDSNLLKFSDILELKLNADLVTLSACETGLGELRTGEGLIGLARAFMYAGSSSVLVSLWKVEDQSTSLLMELFYRGLKRGLSKAEALRQAKIELINTKLYLKSLDMQQSLASPFYWAPFVIFGD